MKERFPKLKDLHFDWLSLVLLLLGLLISTIDYSSTARELEEARHDALVARGRADEALAKHQPRTLLPEQRSKLIKLLNRGARGSVIVQADWTDAEAAEYAQQISSMLEDAGFDIKDVALQVLALRRQGTFLFVENTDHAPTHAVSIYEGFRTNGIPITAANTSPEMKRGIAKDNKQPWEYDSNTAIIWIAQKP